MQNVIQMTKQLLFPNWREVDVIVKKLISNLATALAKKSFNLQFTLLNLKQNQLESQRFIFMLNFLNAPPNFRKLEILLYSIGFGRRSKKSPIINSVILAYTEYK